MKPADLVRGNKFVYCLGIDYEDFTVDRVDLDGEYVLVGVVRDHDGRMLNLNLFADQELDLVPTRTLCAATHRRVGGWDTLLFVFEGDIPQERRLHSYAEAIGDFLGIDVVWKTGESVSIATVKNLTAADLEAASRLTGRKLPTYTLKAR